MHFLWKDLCSNKNGKRQQHVFRAERASARRNYLAGQVNWLAKAMIPSISKEKHRSRRRDFFLIASLPAG